MAEHHLETICPFCGRFNELHTPQTNNKPPVVGDVNICILCGCIGVYEMAEERLVVGRPDSTVVMSVLSNPQYWPLEAARQRMMTPESWLHLNRHV